MKNNTQISEASEKSPRVHIIVPVYNPPEKLFRDCLSSIGRQLHKNFSCILVDDGSQQEIATLCDEATVRDSRFTVIHKKNEGAAFARRDGVLAALADGTEYIAFVDSDDTVDPRYISMMLGALLKTQSDTCFCGMNIVRSGETTYSKWSPSESGTNKDKHSMLLSVLEHPHKCFGARFWVCAGIYRACLFDGVDWFFNKVKIGEDTRLAWQLMLNTRKAFFLCNGLYNHIRHTASAMHTTDSIGLRDFITENLYAMAEFAKQRASDFDFTRHCAIREIQEYYALLGIDGGANGRLSRNETRKCVHHIRHAMKTPGAVSWLPRRQRVGLYVLRFTGLWTYRLYQIIAKWHKTGVYDYEK